MSAEDPVASPIGHGATGFRSNLRDWYQLSGESERQPQTFVELRPAIPVTGAWTEFTTDVYFATLAAQTWDSAALDIVAVDTEKRRLTRAETRTACANTNNSFFWDSATLRLYIHVAADEVPLVDAASTAYVVARPSILVGTDAVTQPMLGPDLLVNGGFDDGGTAGWIVSSGLGITIPTFDPGGDERCLHLTSPDISTAGIAYQDLTLVSGATYCLSGSYFVGANGGRVTVADGSTGANIIGNDGRSYGAANGQTITATTVVDAQDDTSERAQRRRFLFVFIARQASTRIQLEALSGSAAVSAKFDGVKLQRILTWQRSIPLLPSGGVPAIDDGREDLWWGPWRTGQATLTVLNDSGALATLLGTYDFAGSEIVVRHGGRFPHGAEEITADALRVGFVGRVRELTLTEQALTLRCEDTRGVALASLPGRTYTRSEFPDLDPRYDGAPRPVAFGYCEDVPPVRISKTSGGLGIYEVADPEALINGLAVEDATRSARVWLYLDEAAAARGDVTLRTDVTDHVEWDAANGQFTLVKCCKPVPIDGQFFSFNVGGGGFDVLLTPAQQETLIATPTGLGANNNWGVGGSATSVIQGVTARDDGAWADSVSTTGKRRLEVTLAAISGSTAIVSVELRARVAPRDPIDPYATPPAYAKLYIDPGGTGTRYYAPTALENPPSTEFVEISYKWTLNPATSAAFTETERNNLRCGIEWDAGFGAYLRCDLFQILTERISTSAPTATSPGVRSPSQTAALLQAAMNAAASTTDITIVFDESTFLFTADKLAGMFHMAFATGRDPNGWSLLGFETDSDYNSPPAVSSVEPYYTSPDDLDLPVLRVSFLGTADDTSGTYTGLASSPIERGSDVLRYLLQERLRVPSDQIVSGSFDAVRAARSGVVSLYVWEPTNFAEVITLIEASDRADLVIDGIAYRYDVRPTTLGTYSPLLYDREILSLSMRLALEDVASSVRVSYGPGSQVGRGTMPAVEAAVVGVRALYGSADKLELACASAIESDAEALRLAIAAMVARAQRVVELSAYGDVTALRVGEVFGLRATAGVIADSAGSLDVDMRVVRRRVDAETMAVQITAVELPPATTTAAASAAPWRAPWTPHLWAPWHLGPWRIRRIG